MSEDAEDSGPPQIVVTALALVAGVVAQKVVGAAWRFVRGSEPGEDEDSGLAEFVVFAAVTAGAVGAARALVLRNAKGRNRLTTTSWLPPR